METHVAFRNRGETDVATILNNRTTRTMQINIYILAIMHSHLPRGDDNNAILDPSNMSGTSDVTRNN